MRNWKIKCLLLAGILLSCVAQADDPTDAYFQEGNRFDKRGEYFLAARYYFQSLQKTQDTKLIAKTNAYISNALVAQGLYESASYFFLKAVGSGDDSAIRLALNSTQKLVNNVGGILFKKYLLKYTKYNQYSAEQRDYYLYFFAQDALFASAPKEVVRAVDRMSKKFPDYPYALFLRGTSYLILGQADNGIVDFKQCIEMTSSKRKSEIIELHNRCIAGVARAHYQAKRYDEADTWYDKVNINSFVWPQVQYERAWTSTAKGDYNRALGRLVTYKAPALSWFYDSEIEMLRSIGYLQMCLYSDVDSESNLFVSKYGKTGEQMKAMLESASDGNTEALVKLFQRGASALKDKVQSDDPMNQIMNRFVRSPYFEQLVLTSEKVKREASFLNAQGDAGRKGLGAFLRDVLVWRTETAQEVGGQFVRDRLATEYKNLLSHVSTMDIVKLEMLRRAKGRAESRASSMNNGVDAWGEKKRGSLGRPQIKDGQYYWDFNGEFWADELGDYVFALRPECN